MSSNPTAIADWAWNETWMGLVNGSMFNILKPDLSRVGIDTIAHSLARICRFNGHVDGWISVGQHSCLVCDRVFERTGDHDAAMAALLHDAHESFVGDNTRPLKVSVKVHAGTDAIKDIEAEIDREIERRFGVDFGRWHEVIKEADNYHLFQDALIYGLDELKPERRTWVPKDIIVERVREDWDVNRATTEFVSRFFVHQKRAVA
jgi:hypothetical protein